MLTAVVKSCNENYYTVYISKAYDCNYFEGVFHSYSCVLSS